MKNNNTNTTNTSKIQVATQVTLDGTEFLGTIARQFGTTTEAIEKMNGGLDTTELYRGRTILVPGKLISDETGNGHISASTHKLKPIYREMTESEMENNKTTTKTEAPAEKAKTRKPETAWTLWNERNKTADLKRELEKSRRELDTNNFVNRVYASLKDATDEISRLKAERESIIARQKSGELGRAYDQQVLNLGTEISRATKQAEVDGYRLVDEYVEALRASQTLNPAHMTADVQFLQMGVSLTKEDLVAMAERNAGNATMLRLINDYASKNNIELPGEYRYDLDMKVRIESTEAVRTIVDVYCARWITGKDPLNMLNRFFGLS